MSNAALSHYGLLALLTVMCCVPLGLLFRSSAESKARGREPSMFVLDSVIGIVASLLVKALWVAALFIAPSLLLLHALGHDPRTDTDMRIWVLSSFIGVGLGKLIRWLNWRRAQDFV